LHADYSADTSIFLVNLAACILSHDDFNTLFCITLRFRHPPTYTGLIELPLYQFPSWVPDPTSWTSRVLEPVIGPNNEGQPFPLPAYMQDPGPKISLDSTILFLTAAHFDPIAQHCPILDIHRYEGSGRCHQSAQLDRSPGSSCIPSDRPSGIGGSCTHHLIRMSPIGRNKRTA
jgi:hypothetical protein